MMMHANEIRLYYAHSVTVVLKALHPPVALL